MKAKHAKAKAKLKVKIDIPILTKRKLVDLLNESYQKNDALIALAGAYKDRADGAEKKMAENDAIMERYIKRLEEDAKFKQMYLVSEQTRQKAVKSLNSLRGYKDTLEDENERFRRFLVRQGINPEEVLEGKHANENKDR